MSALRKKTFSKGEVIFSEGDPGDCGYIIERGKIEISVQRNDKKQIVAILEAGEIFGEMAVIDEFTRSATATCTEKCVAHVVSKKQLSDRINASDPVVRMLVKVLIQRLRKDLGSLESTISSIKEDIRAINQSRQGDGVDQDRQNAIEKIRTEGELQNALENEDLRLFYQPIVDLRSAQIVGFEALLRWIHPKLGFIRPDAFITLAEETDLIIPIGRWVLYQALQDLAALQSASSSTLARPSGLFMSVNISGKQIPDPKFFESFHKALDSSKVNPRHVKLEITETALVESNEAIEWIRRCKEIGASISLDDFGTGHSSLSYLTKFKIDCLKLDKSFLDQWLTDSKSLVVAKAIVKMAHELKLVTVAEGIELEKHVEILKSMKCEYGQGYLFGKPMDVSQAIDLILRAGKAA